MKKKIKLSKFEWVKKNIVIVPVVAAILAGTFTSVRYVINLTDTMNYFCLESYGFHLIILMIFFRSMYISV